MDFHIKLLIPNEIIVVHPNSLLNYLVDLEILGFLEAQIHQDSVVIYDFGRHVTL